MVDSLTVEAFDLVANNFAFSHIFYHETTETVQLIGTFFSITLSEDLDIQEITYFDYRDDIIVFRKSIVSQEGEYGFWGHAFTLDTDKVFLSKFSADFELIEEVEISHSWFALGGMSESTNGNIHIPLNGVSLIFDRDLNALEDADFE